MTRALARRVRQLYDWIDLQVRTHADSADPCVACGRCCDFDTFDHRLFVTAAEMIVFADAIGPENARPMTVGVCPYLQQGQCSVYDHRFAGCRIFCCKGDPAQQRKLTESALDRLKEIGTESQVPYRYLPLADALRATASDIGRWAEGSCRPDHAT